MPPIRAPSLEELRREKGQCFTHTYLWMLSNLNPKTAHLTPALPLSGQGVVSSLGRLSCPCPRVTEILSPLYP